MVVQVRLEGDRALRRQLRALAEQFPKDAQRAVNKAAQRAATGTRRDLSKAIGLPQREIKNRIAYFRAGKVRKWASVWVGVKSSIPLAKVGGARMNLTGRLSAGKVRVQTFKATMPSGKTGSFVRKPGSRHRQRPDGQMTELPIEEPRVRIGPTARPIVLKHCNEQMRMFYPKELQRLAALTARRAAAKRSKR